MGVRAELRDRENSAKRSYDYKQVNSIIGTKFIHEPEQQVSIDNVIQMSSRLFDTKRCAHRVPAAGELPIDNRHERSCSMDWLRQGDDGIFLSNSSLKGFGAVCALCLECE